MECRVVVSSLSDILDGRDMWLSDDEVREMEMHLAECPACQGIRADLAEIRTAARELPMHSPPASLWVRISNEIEAEIKASNAPTKFDHETKGIWGWIRSRRFSVSVPQLAGAGAVALLAIAVGLVGSTPRSLFNSMSISGIQTAVIVPGEIELKAEIDKKLAAVNDRKKNWDPQLREDFERHLNRIENSIQSCRELLQTNPGDQVQQQMVRALYNEKKQLLEDVERLKW